MELGGHVHVAWRFPRQFLRGRHLHRAVAQHLGDHVSWTLAFTNPSVLDVVCVSVESFGLHLCSQGSGDLGHAHVPPCGVQ